MYNNFIGEAYTYNYNGFYTIILSIRLYVGLVN